MNNLNKKLKMLLQRVSVTFAITLFCVLVSLLFSNKVDAAGFEYKDFNWDVFYEYRKDYWDTTCNKKLGCDFDKYMKSQKGYYTKLYKVLAKYEAKSLHINDNAIIETSFFNTQPSEFNQDGEYIERYQTSTDQAIKSDGTEDFDIENSPQMFEADADFYERETDTIKVLAKNMIAYSTECHGVYGNATLKQAEDGSKYYVCAEGKAENIGGAMLCTDKLATNELGFWEYFISVLEHEFGIAKLFLGKHPYDQYYNECMATEGYPGGMKYLYMDDEHVSYDKYFDFLYSNNFFDTRFHLMSYYSDILKDTKRKEVVVKCIMTETCEDSLESLDLLDEYEEDIKEARLEIIRDIVETLRMNGQDDINYYRLEYTESDYTETESEIQRKTIYWPIGSDEIEEKDGVKFANKDPASTEIVSYYGERTNPATGESETHYGIDISGEDGKTNVIAVQDGTVLEVSSGCSVGDYYCNGGLGNLVVISHSNGDYSYYGSLSNIESYISTGKTIKKGTVIGQVGQTGATTSPILHFEYRVGGNSIDNAVNPLDYLSESEPRPEPPTGDFADTDFSIACTSLSRDEYITKSRMYCSKNYCPQIMKDDLGRTYDLSIQNGINPELTLIRAHIERTSKGYNYWGIGYYNGMKHGKTYSSYEAAIADFAKIAKKNGPMASQMMSTYGYLGDYWYTNIGKDSWGLGGCIYAPYVYPKGIPERVQRACAPNAPFCGKNGGPQCTPTTQEDRYGYNVFLVKAMADLRYTIYGLKGVASCQR